MSTRPLRPRSPWSKRAELFLERLMWRLRLMAILPVVMSLVSTAVSFTLGTVEIVRALALLGRGTPSETLVPKLLGGVVSGVDLFLIGIALLIFGYGVYELLISPIEAAREDDASGNGLLDIRNLDQLKEKLVKVLVVALIVAAFKAMVTLPIRDASSLAFFCLSVLLLACSAYLMTSGGARTPPR